MFVITFAAEQVSWFATSGATYRESAGDTCEDATAWSTKSTSLLRALRFPFLFNAACTCASMPVRMPREVVPPRGTRSGTMFEKAGLLPG